MHQTLLVSSLLLYVSFSSSIDRVGTRYWHRQAVVVAVKVGALASVPSVAFDQQFIEPPAKPIVLVAKVKLKECKNGCTCTRSA